MGSPARRTRVLVVGLAGVVGALGGAILGFQLGPVFLEPPGFGESIVARLFEFTAELVIAGWAGAVGAMAGWLALPAVSRALLRWPEQARSLAFQALSGLVLWPALFLIALLTVDLQFGTTIALAVPMVFVISSLSETLAIRRQL